MKNILLFLAIFTASLFFGNQSFAQCTPGDSTTCPDPENNGEVCPAVLPPIYIGVAYSQQFTVLAPPKIDSLNIDLHHITLIDVLNLPQGISWESNAPSNEFMVGTYYCVLLSGETESSPGNYPLKIVVDIYTSVFGVPVLLGQTTDSTSLSVEVAWNPNAVGENIDKLCYLKTWPNPFVDELNIQLNEYETGEASVEIFNLLGSRIYSKSFQPDAKGTIKINTSSLIENDYLLSVLYNSKRYSKIVSKLN